MFSLGRQQDQDTLKLVRNANFQSVPQIDGIRNSGSEPSNLCMSKQPRWLSCMLEQNCCSKAELGNPEISLTGWSFSISNLKQLLLVQPGAAHVKGCMDAAKNTARANLRICFYWSRSAPLWSSLLRSTACHYLPLAMNRCCNSRLESSACPFSVQNNSRKTVLYHTLKAKLACF